VVTRLTSDVEVLGEMFAAGIITVVGDVLVLAVKPQGWRTAAQAVAPHLARDRRWRAIQSCRDLPDRAAIGLKAGNLAAVFQ
jgi:hypothetical protein